MTTPGDHTLPASLPRRDTTRPGTRPERRSRRSTRHHHHPGVTRPGPRDAAQSLADQHHHRGVDDRVGQRVRADRHVEHVVGSPRLGVPTRPGPGYLRHVDTLVITKLDRLGRSVQNLKDITAQLRGQGVGCSPCSKASTPPPPAAGSSSTCWPPRRDRARPRGSSGLATDSPPHGPVAGAAKPENDQHAHRASPPDVRLRRLHRPTEPSTPRAGSCTTTRTAPCTAPLG